MIEHHLRAEVLDVTREVWCVPCAKATGVIVSVAYTHDGQIVEVGTVARCQECYGEIERQ